jgi:hypothetical protein
MSDKREIKELLRMDSYIQCDECKRKSFGGDSINSYCNMRQPNGKICKGKFRSKDLLT